MTAKLKLGGYMHLNLYTFTFMPDLDCIFVCVKLWEFKEEWLLLKNFF